MSSKSHPRMVTFEEAQEILLQKAPGGSAVDEMPIVEAVGYVLAERIEADIEMPRFDKAAMDGFAFRHQPEAEREPLRITRTIAAGDAPGAEIAAGECMRIMTGAPVPEGADTVIPVEDTSLVDADGRQVEGETEWVRFHALPDRGAHIAVRGEDVARGDVLLQPGHLLKHQSVSILASIGRATVRVFAGPSIAFAATGEELIEPGAPLAPGKIYNANASALWSQILGAKGRPHYLGVIRDNVHDLRRTIATGLEHDMLILSGGVSMGRFDFVPDVLEELGVQLHFHRLLVKPGRPTIFGTRGNTLVFGLPGNPISTLYAFDQYVAPAVRVFRHHPRPRAVRYRGELTETVRKPSGRMLLQPCRCEWDGEQYLLTPLRTHGSADIFAIAEADALALIPAGIEEVERGKIVAFRRLFES